ncbi:unnamed protein product [Pieris macdunnoughi]|uniref:Uncharacterized protein n=1 Tax=Pieris macdunnoughi TaxID=345717 RepID=A0A821RK87_9NEOP|nr:unnamed protein product [Pieris macdunnoughi]
MLRYNLQILGLNEVFDLTLVAARCPNPKQPIRLKIAVARPAGASGRAGRKFDVTKLPDPEIIIEDLDLYADALWV